MAVRIHVRVHHRLRGQRQVEEDMGEWGKGGVRVVYEQVSRSPVYAIMNMEGAMSEESFRITETKYTGTRTCSLVFHTLLARPPSRINFSKTIKGVSRPLPSFDFEAAEPVPPERYANPPRR